MFIEVLKVSSEKKKATDGSEVRNPADRSVVHDDRLVTHKELIRVDEIRSARAWEKNANQEAYIEGPMIKLYLHGDVSKKTRPEMLIAESLESFRDRIKAIKHV